MPRSSWRGQWYVYNHITREFLRTMDGKRPPIWTPGVKHAWAYKNPAAAQKCASRLNAQLHHPGSACWPCQPVSVVTGEAARCLDAINRRDGATSFVSASADTFPSRGRL